MSRPARRRKIKNPSSKVSRKVANKKTKKTPSFSGVNSVIRENWDKTLTLKQNYERLGLVSTINGRAGGTLGDAPDSDSDWTSNNSSTKPVEIQCMTIEEFDRQTREQKAQVDGLHVVDEDAEGPIAFDPRALIIGDVISQRTLPKTIGNPESSSEKNPIIAQLEAIAAQTVKHERHLSEQETLWTTECIQKYGLDYKKMSRDLKLNKMQLTEKQIRKKIETFLNKMGVEYSS